MKPFFRAIAALDKPERRTLFGVSVMVLLLIVLAGLASYWMVREQSQRLLAHSMQMLTQNKASELERKLRLNMDYAQWLAGRPALLKPLARLQGGNDQRETFEALQEAVTQMLGNGVSGVVVIGETQRVLASAGEAVSRTELSLPLNGPIQSSLDWDESPVMITHVDLVRDGARVGILRVVFRSEGWLDLPPSYLNLGKSAELALCAALDAERMRCFPTRLNPRVAHAFPRMAGDKPLPMSWALAGQTGFVVARDYRGQQVGAGYAPLGDTGLGMVFKADTAELYASLGQLLGKVALVLAVLVLVGMLILYRMVGPLMARLHRAEQAAKESEYAVRNSQQRVQSVLENVNQAIVVVNGAGEIERYNAAAQRIFGCLPDEVLAQPMGKLIAEDPGAVWARHGDTQAEVVGRRQDGSLFPAEVRISQIELDGEWLRIVAVQDITERKSAEEQMRFLASHDALTGLANRNLLQDRVRQAIVQAERNTEHVGLLFIDLDNFKAINDTLGHRVGDQLLQIVAKRIQGCIREVDTVARQGGDEFIVVLSGAARFENVGIVAGKILQSVSAPYSIDGAELHTSASIGVSVYPDDGADVETLMRHADVAMYHAKHRGRANYQFFAPEMNRVASERMQLESKLRNALERDEFQLNFQPIVALGTNAVHGAEVLLRWNPESGPVGPDRFIPVAEESGLIVPIGEWVLRNACRQFKVWQAEGCQLGRLAVNLSVRQFAQKNLVAMVGRILQETELEPQHLGLEITESLLMENPVDAIRALNALSDMGVEISIDDFGTGYSSLSYLKRFPINKIKIDRSFVRDVVSDPEDAAIVTAIIAMAHSLQCKVVAEGVETEDQLAFLRERGCDEYQGFYFSRPMPAEELKNTFSSLLRH